MKLKFFTNKKIIFISIFLFLIIASSVPLYLFTSSFCKTYKIIYSVKDFGLNQINDCFSRYQMKQSVKEILRDYPLLYNLAASFKDKNIKDFELNKPPKSEDLINLPSDIEKPKNIVGLINNESNHRTDYKSFKKQTFEKWTRSHGDNYNLKFLNDNNINLDNIQNLKLFWSYSTIDDDYKFSDTSTHSPYILNKKNLKNKWKQNIQVNPIFLNGKLVFISADWKIVCVDIESKKVLWELQTIFPPSRRGIVAYTKNETTFSY